MYSVRHGRRRPRAGSVSGAHAGSGHAALPVPSERGRYERAASAGQGQGHRGNKWWTLVAVCLGTFMLLLDITIVNVALPDIQDALHSSFSGLQWVVDAYALSLAALLLTTGSLADMYGRRLFYVIGLVIFTGAGCRRSAEVR